MSKLQFFAMRSMGSGGAFHRAYTNATQQAFLEGHEHGFRYFGGVFHDNLSIAAKKILRGRQREETERIIGFRSHWGFQSEYCNPARGNEKGGVENELGWYRRNFLVPIPEAPDFVSLNTLLLARCIDSQQHIINERSMNIAAAVQHILRMPDAAERRQHALVLAEELMQFERPIPKLDDYDLLLADSKEVLQ